MINEALKVLVIVDSFPPHHLGGYELRCRDIVEGMRNRGHEILVLTTQCPESCVQTHHDEVGVLRCLHNKSLSKSTLSRVIREWIDVWNIILAIKRYNPDLIALYHLGDLSNEIIPLLAESRLPLVLDDGGLASLHALSVLHKAWAGGRPITRWWKTTLRRVARFALAPRADKDGRLGHDKILKWPSNLNVCFNSESSYAYARSRGAVGYQSGVIYSGIHESLFVFRHRDSLQPPIHIITPGRICAEKGTIDSIRLIEALSRRGIQATLSIIGPLYDPQYSDYIRSAIQSSSEADSIRLIPSLAQSDLVNEYHMADFCFFPSHQVYGFSRVPLEAMATGCVVLTYGNESSREIIDSGRTGIIVPEGEIAAAVDAIHYLIGNPHVYHSIVYSARKMIEEKFTMKRYLDKIEDYWLSIVRATNTN